MLKYIYIIATIALLTACANQKLFSKNNTDTIQCPQIYLLKGTDRVARFIPTNDKKPNIKNLIFEARSIFGNGKCQFNPKQKILTLTFPVGALIKKSPIFKNEIGNQSNQNIQFFIAAKNQQQNITAQKTITLNLKDVKNQPEDKQKSTPLFRAFFKDKERYDRIFNKNISHISSPATIQINTQNENPNELLNHKIYVGIVITENELKYNKQGYLPHF